MKKWLFIAILMAIVTPAMGARQTVVRTDLFGAGWTKQNNMNLELYQKTDPAETGFTGMGGEVITSGSVPSAKSLSPDKTSGVPSVNFLYEANGTDTNGFGFLGPASSTKNILYRISDESPAVGNVFKVDSIATDQTITVGAGSIVADVVTLILAAETGGGGASFVEQADDPTSSSEDGYFYGATTSGDFFYKSSTGLFNITAGTYTADPTTPTLVSLTIPEAGTTAEGVFSEAVSYGAGGSGGWTLNSPTNAMTYSSGTGTDTIVFNLASTILSTDTPTVSYPQPGNGFESSDDGVDLASISNASVINNSTQTGESYADIIFWSGFEGDGSPSYTGTTGDYPENLTATAASLAIVSATAAKIGTKGLYIQSSSDYFTFSSPIGASFNAQRHGLWVNMPTWTNGTYLYVDQYDASNFLRVSAATGGEIKVELRNAGTYDVSATTTGLSLSNSTWYYIEVIMDQAGNGLTLKVDGVNTSIINDAYTAFAVAPVSTICGNSSSTTGITYIDNVVMSSDIARDFYALRNNTESPR